MFMVIFRGMDQGFHFSLETLTHLHSLARIEVLAVSKGEMTSQESGIDVRVLHSGT